MKCALRRCDKQATVFIDIRDLSYPADILPVCDEHGLEFYFDDPDEEQA